MVDDGPSDDVLLTAAQLDRIVDLWHEGLALLEDLCDPGSGILPGLRAENSASTRLTNSLAVIEADLARARSRFLGAMQPLLDSRDRP